MKISCRYVDKNEYRSVRIKFRHDSFNPVTSLLCSVVSRHVVLWCSLGINTPTYYVRDRPNCITRRVDRGS